MKRLIRQTTSSFKPVKVRKSGALFEQLVGRINSALEKSDDIVVHTNIYLVNNEGRKRQIDVFIESKVNSYPLGIAIECKDYSGGAKKTPVDVDKVESFKSKCERIPAIHKMILASTTGYTEGARDAAKIYGIELIHLDEIATPHQIFEWVKPIRLYLQKRVIGITSILVKTKDDIFHVKYDIDSTKVKMEDFGESASLRDTCISYLMNQSLEDWRANFRGGSPLKPTGCGFILTPYFRMTLEGIANSPEVDNILFKAIVKEKNIELIRKQELQYSSNETGETARVLILEGNHYYEKAIAELILPVNSEGVLTLNYSLINGKEIILSESDRLNLKNAFH